jgi:hypothetical protein
VYFLAMYRLLVFTRGCRYSKTIALSLQARRRYFQNEQGCRQQIGMSRCRKPVTLGPASTSTAQLSTPSALQLTRRACERSPPPSRSSQQMPAGVRQIAKTSSGGGPEIFSGKMKGVGCRRFSSQWAAGPPEPRGYWDSIAIATMIPNAATSANWKIRNRRCSGLMVLLD